MIFDRRALVLSAGPHGRHWIPGESLRKSSARCRTKASAQGWISPAFMSAATLPEYFAEILCQIPDKSGLPSTVRGAGAVRFGLPLAVRGMPGVGYFSHCAATVIVTANKIIMNTMGFITSPSWAKGVVTILAPKMSGHKEAQKFRKMLSVSLRSLVSFVPFCGPFSFSVITKSLENVAMRQRGRNVRHNSYRFIAIPVAVALLFIPLSLKPADSLPAQISDAAFWRMVTGFSEEAGSFRFQYMSNEREFAALIPDLKKSTKPGGVYLGVGPEQNFSYIAALRPRIAFIFDIRRQNMLEHLLYKAVFEMSPNRVEFISRLFSRRTPAGVNDKSTVNALFQAFGRAPRE